MEYNQFKNYSILQRLQLIEQWRESFAIDNLIMSFEDEVFEVANKASEELVKIGQVTVDKLITATGSPNKDISSWAIITIEQMESIGVKSFVELSKIALTHPNRNIRVKARKGVIRSFLTIMYPVRRSMELIFYFVLITIVQLVMLILILVPIVGYIDNILPIRQFLLKETLVSFLLASIIPILSGFVVAQIIKLKEQNYFLAGFFGIVQNIPYNFFLAFATFKLSVINSFVPIFGMLGAMLGHYYFLKELAESQKKVKQPQFNIFEDQRRTIFLIKERMKMSKRFQDSIITISAILGLILIIYISISIYQLSSVSNIAPKSKIKTHVLP